jgi:hypothetical protein
MLNNFFHKLVSSIVTLVGLFLICYVIITSNELSEKVVVCGWIAGMFLTIFGLIWLHK